MGARYESRIVAFVDILGASALLSAKTSEAYANNLYKLVSAICKRRDEIWLVLPHIRTAKEVEIEIFSSFQKGAKLNLMSDAFVLSFPEWRNASTFNQHGRFPNILACLETVFQLQRGLFRLGILSRGGIAIGKIFHTQQSVIGQGLVRAYNLERKSAIYPRTIVDESILDILLAEPVPDIVLAHQRIAHLIRLDEDGQYFVDYLGHFILGADRLRYEYELVFDSLSQELNATDDMKVSEKLKWLLRYLISSSDTVLSGNVNMEVNAGSKFGSKYYRTNESLRDWLAANEGLLIPRKN